jgi:hypothetical protein
VARKRLINGANATRVEERIARVPADVLAAEAGPSIFGALRAMETSSKELVKPSSEPAQSLPGQAAGPVEPAIAAPPTAPGPRSQSAAPGPAQRKSSARNSPRKRVETTSPSPKKAVEAAEPEAVAAASEAAPAEKAPRHGRVGPSDFSAAERAEIVRCCSDYRNRLPIYLQAVQLEVEVIDSVIEKCRTSKEGFKKP